MPDESKQPDDDGTQTIEKEIEKLPARMPASLAELAQRKAAERKHRIDQPGSEDDDKA